MYFIANSVVYSLFKLTIMLWLLPFFSLKSEEEPESEEEGEDPNLDSLSQAIAFQVSL